MTPCFLVNNGFTSLPRSASASPVEMMMFDSRCGLMNKSSARKSTLCASDAFSVQLKLQAKWSALAGEAGCPVSGLQHPPPSSVLELVLHNLLPCFFFHYVQLTSSFSFGFIHSVHVLILLCELIQLQSDYIHVLLKSHCLFKMAFSDPCSRGLIIYVDFVI